MADHVPVRTYDPAEVNLAVGGVIITGVAEGSWITVSRAEDNFTTYTGAKGETAIAESNNRTGTVSVTLENTSPSATYLYNLSKRKGNRALVDVSVIDANEEGGIRWSAPEGRVKRPPDFEASNTITTREFEIFVADLDYDVNL